MMKKNEKTQSRRKFLELGAASALCFASGRTALADATADDETLEPGVIPVDSYIDEAATNSTSPVGMIWVLCADISSSIKDENGEYDAQVEAFANAIERDDFRESIFAPNGPGSAAIFFLDFGWKSRLEIAGVDFRENNRDHFRAFADRIRNRPRREIAGGTTHAPALENAGICFQAAQESGWVGEDTKCHVNVMTDGYGSHASQNHHYREMLARHYGASVSSMIIRPRPDAMDDYPVDVFNWCERDLTTPGNTFIGPNNEFVPAGFTEEVAKEEETRDGGTQRYRDRTFLVMRRQITSRTAGLQLNDNDTRFAAAQPITRRGLIL